MKKKVLLKDNLLKTLLIFFGVFFVLSWIIPSGSYEMGYVEGKISPIGIFDLLKYPLYTLATFLQYGMVVLAVGIFYAILSKTGVYYDLCNNIASKIKNKKLFLGILTFVLVLLSSMLGQPLALFIFVPFIYNIIVLLGYDKKTGFAVAIGTILIGNICSLTGSGIALAANDLFNIGLTKDLLIKIIFFMMISLLYVNLVLSHSKEEKEELILCEKVKTKKSSLPAKVLIIFTFVIVILGVFDLSIFNFTLFKDIHTSVMNFEVNGFYLFQNLFKGIEPLGSWTNYDLIEFLLLMSIIISWVYSLKFDEIIESTKEGITRTIKPALYIMIVSIIFCVILNSESNIMETINNAILKGDFSIIKTSLASISGGIFYNDYAWLLSSGYGKMLVLNDTNNYFLISLIGSSIHSLLMLVLPTSLLLAPGLSLTNIDYKEWLKYIWKFVLMILFVIIVISIIVFKFI